MTPDDDPVLVVGGANGSGVDGRWPSLPMVVVGLGPEATDEVDVVVRDADELDEVTAAVRAHPDAAVALAMLLRGGAGRSVAAGLIAESTTYGLLQGAAEHRAWLAARRGPAARSAPSTPVVAERDGDVIRARLARPELRNAYGTSARDALVELLDVVAADPSVRVELRGDGPDFCSGGDLAEFGTTTDPAVAHRIRLARSPARSLAAVGDRVTVHVHGACVGAGIELAAFARRVVAASDARFWLPELSMGLIPGAGGTVSIPRRIGRHRAAWWALTGRTIDARTALEWGLVDEVGVASDP